MQYDDAQRKRQYQGNEDCEHPDYDKEYYLGAQTGDYVCTSCGAVLDAADRAEIDQRQAKNRSVGG